MERRQAPVVLQQLPATWRVEVYATVAVFLVFDLGAQRRNLTSGYE